MKLTLLYSLLQIFIIFYTQSAQSASAPWVGNDLNNNACSGGAQGYGPFDYLQKSHFKKELELVETAHFTYEVENLIKGNAGNLLQDLDYTLRAWPNHHRALLSVIRFQLEVKNKLRSGKLQSPAECYIQRALHFSPQDAVNNSLYGHYLHKIGFIEKAIEYYEKALKLDPENAKFSYSYSLLLIDMKRYEDAVKYAKIAYKRRDTPKGLKQKLEKLGVWND
ncbi:MAG: hypothetical protein CTY19_03210 [Methylomonas sp.]|nr:MAG: hypothetical protein CTY19_03210 [Methylomonas sp.]